MGAHIDDRSDDTAPNRLGLRVRALERLPFFSYCVSEALYQSALYYEFIFRVGSLGNENSYYVLYADFIQANEILYFARMGCL